MSAKSSEPKVPVEVDPLAMLRDMRRKLRFLVIATVASYLVAGAIALFAWSVSDTLKTGVCNLREDLQQRIESSREFLEDHPHGAPQLGISAGAIREQIHNQERTRDALDNVRC